MKLTSLYCTGLLILATQLSSCASICRQANYPKDTGTLRIGETFTNVKLTDIRMQRTSPQSFPIALATMTNETDTPQSVTYQYQWFDKNGIPQGTTNNTLQTLEPNQSITIYQPAPNTFSTHYTVNVCGQMNQ